jgi:hypothetical protein
MSTPTPDEPERPASLSSLSIDIQRIIADLIEPSDLINLARVSKSWQAPAEERRWKTLQIDMAMIPLVLHRLLQKK